MFPVHFFKSAAQPKLGTSSCSKDIRYTLRQMDSSKARGKEPEKIDPPLKKGNDSCLKPFTRQNLLYYYVPALGTASYTILSINVLNPSMRFR